MFTKTETQLIAKTLTQRREWLVKNINTPEQAANLPQNQQTLQIIDSALAKLLNLYKQPVHEVSSAPKKPTSNPQQKHAQLLPADIRVLVVDDDTLISSMMKVLLETYGVKTVDIAEDGLKAISMLYDANPVYDLVLCDWNMPIKSGIDVHNAMRAAERYTGTCFILVTAVTEAKQIRAAIDEGVDDYIVKPIEEEKIIKKIGRHFPKLLESNQRES